LAKQMTTHFPGGYISVDGDRIVGIVEKPKPGEEPSDLVNIVIHAHKRAALVQALADIPDLKGDGYSQVEQLLMQRSRYELARYTGTWYAFKYPWDAIKALPLFLGLITKPSIHPTAKIHPSAVIEGPVVIDEGASVLAHAIITGPVYIGPQSVVGYGTIVRGGSIGHHCAVNGRSEIKNCVLYPHVWTHGTYLGDSVIAENVSFGNGCNAGNLRLDEDEIASSVRGTKLNTGLKKFGTAVGEGCRFGFGVGLYPGVKVGRHTFVASHALLASDVPEKRFIHVQNGVLDVRENTTSAPHPEDSERSHWKQEFDQR
jgi:bifunctional UDP-N-acetylglucosamine pyrophosphorylase/glucosamine-1-phosphate N-acetyltransferase